MRGLAVIFISHNIHHAYPVGDTFTLLNRGRNRGTYRKSEISRDEVDLDHVGRRGPARRSRPRSSGCWPPSASGRPALRPEPAARPAARASRSPRAQLLDPACLIAGVRNSAYSSVRRWRGLGLIASKSPGWLKCMRQKGEPRRDRLEHRPVGGLGIGPRAHGVSSTMSKTGSPAGPRRRHLGVVGRRVERAGIARRIVVPQAPSPAGPAAGSPGRAGGRWR